MLLPWIVCGLGALFYCYEYFLRITPSIMTQELMGVFHINAAQLGNLAAFYYYAYTPMQLPVGMLMDRYGPRRLLTLACLLCAIGSYLFAINVLSLSELGRFLVGFGSAFAFVGVLKLATIWLPPNRFAFVAGMVTALGMAGAMGGDIALASFVDAIGWHATVFITSVLGMILAFILWAVIRDSRADVTHTKTVEAENPTTFAALFASVLQLIKQPVFWVNGIIGCLLFLPLTAFAEFWGVPYLQHAQHLSKLNAATAASMVFLGFAIGGAMMGYISDKRSVRKLPIFFGSVFSALMACLLLYTPRLPSFEVYALTFALGFFASAQIIVFAIAKDSTSRQFSATAIALTNLFIMLGGAMFQPLIGSLLDAHAHGTSIDNIALFTVADYRYAISVLPIGLLAAAFLSLFLPSDRLLKQEEQQAEIEGQTLTA